MEQIFLIKYGEIGLKGKNRYLFEDALVRQIRYMLKGIPGSFHVYKAQGRVYVDCTGEFDFEETVSALQKVFGIVGICPVTKTSDQGFERLAEDVVSHLKRSNLEEGYTFKVEARRSRKNYPLNSMEINRE
jgi:thiamine biosynthesis protein ThiI